MAISGIGGGVDLAALARSNSLQYTGGSSLSALTGATNSSSDTLSIDGIGADSLGLSAAELGLARQSGASAAGASRAGRVQAQGIGGVSFEDSLLKAMDGVNADQQKTSNLIQKMVVAPDSVNAHDVTIAMAESNLSLNLARTILDRITRGWKEIINIR